VVEDFNLRRTVIRDLDGTVHFIPNGEVRIVCNLSKDYARVNLDISIAYEQDIDRAISVINSVGQEMLSDPDIKPNILEVPSVLRVDSLSDSSVEIKVLGTTKRLEQWGVAGELRRRIKYAFDREGIEIPFPHIVVSPRGDWRVVAPGVGTDGRNR
jgi:small-conductance mechanosensitive channel